VSIITDPLLACMIIMLNLVLFYKAHVTRLQFRFYPSKETQILSSAWFALAMLNFGLTIVWMTFLFKNVLLK